MSAETVEPCRHIIRDARFEYVGARIACANCNLLATVGHRWLKLYRVAVPDVEIGRIPWEPREEDFSKVRR